MYISIACIVHNNPFLLLCAYSCEAGAHEIKRAIEKGKAHHGFPFVMEHLVMCVARMLPCGMYDLFVSAGAVATESGVQGTLHS